MSQILRASVQYQGVNPFVRKYNKDIEESALRIGEDIALAIHSENFREKKSLIKEYPIVLITHERYKQLSLDRKQRELFTQGRTTLIIDERIDMLEIYEYSKERIKWFTEILPPSLKLLYRECVEELDLQIEVLRSRTFFNAKTDISNALDKLRKQMKKIIPNMIFVQSFESFIDSEWGKKTIVYKRSNFLKELDIIKNFYSNTCCEDNQKLYTFDNRIQYTLLDNNIILDACANFNKIYKLSPLFKVAKQDKVIDHGQWTVHHTIINTTKNAKSKYIDFYSVVKEHLKSILKPGDKIFICGNKSEDEEEWKNKLGDNDQVSINHFRNIVGSNEWRDFNKIYITHTPNTPFHVYVLNYLYYSGKTISNRGKWSMKKLKDSNVYGFKNKEYDAVRTSFLVEEIYQAIKRINRDNQFPADVYILNNDQKIINIVLQQMKNVKYEEYELDIKKKKNNQDNYNLIRQTNAKYMKFVNMLKKLPSGKYRKNDLRERLGIINKSLFSSKVLNHRYVIDYMNKNEIISKGQQIIIP